MSKKISIVCPGIIRSGLLSSFRSYLVRKRKDEIERAKRYRERYGRFGPRSFSLYDDDYDEEMALLRALYGYYDDDNINDYINDGLSNVHPTDDDDDGLSNYEIDDEGCIVFPIYKGKRNGSRSSKRGHRGHHSKHCRRSGKVIDIDVPYSGYEGSDFIELNDDENGSDVNGSDISSSSSDISLSSSNKIYFYPNAFDKYDRLEFDSLLEFDSYCQEEGFSVPPYVGEQLAYNPVNHCCLNPVSRQSGILEIMANESYAEMMYEASEASYENGY